MVVEEKDLTPEWQDFYFQQNGCRALTMWWFSRPKFAFHGWKYTVERQTEKGNFKECSVSFLWTNESFSLRNCPRNSTLFSSVTAERLTCFDKMQPRQRSFWRIFRYILYNMVKKSTLLKENVCIYKGFLDVSYILASRDQNTPRLEMDFVLNFAIC